MNKETKNKPCLLKTEQFDPSYKNIDLWSDRDVLLSIVDSQAQTMQAVKAAIPEIARAATAAAECLKKSGRLIYIGAGTSIRLGVQDGTELPPTFGWPQDRLAFVIAGGERALFTAIEGAEDNIHNAKEDIDKLSINEDDVCIALSASGMTPYTVFCCTYAREKGAMTIGIACNQNSDLLTKADYPIFLNTPPEPIAGSTRMSAGTGQKAVLNMISTLIMIRLGRVYNGLMVDVELNNQKLIDRAHRIISQITSCSRQEAEAALRQSKNSVKLAILIAKGFSVTEGRKLLADYDHDLRKIIS